MGFVKRKHLLLVAVSAFVAGALYLGVALLAGLEEVTSALLRSGPVCVIVALASSVCNITLRFLRWQMFLRVLGHKLPVSVHVPIYVAGFSLTTIPGKLGELIRSVFLHEHGVRYSKSVAAFFADRLADLTGVLFTASLLSWFVYPAAARILTAFAILLAIALGIIRIAGPSVAGRLVRLAPGSWRMEAKLAGAMATLENLRACLSLPLFGLGVAIAALAYSAQAFALWYIVKSLGVDASTPAVMLSFLVSLLGGAASMLPAGLGSMEAALVTLLNYFGVPLPSAVAATVLIRLATLWFVVGAGLACLIWLQLRHDVASSIRPAGL